MISSAYLSFIHTTTMTEQFLAMGTNDCLFLQRALRALSSCRKDNMVSIGL